MAGINNSYRRVEERKSHFLSRSDQDENHYKSFFHILPHRTPKIFFSFQIFFSHGWNKNSYRRVEEKKSWFINLVLLSKIIVGCFLSRSDQDENHYKVFSIFHQEKILLNSKYFFKSVPPHSLKWKKLLSVLIITLLLKEWIEESNLINF